MEISLGNDWYLGKDQYNWILMKSIPIKEGKNAGGVRMATVGYYPNVELACRAVVDKDIGSSGIKTMEELKSVVDASTRSLCDAVKKAQGKLVL